MDQDSWTNPESTIGLLPNAIINNGLELDVVVCVLEPVSKHNDRLACDFDGGIVNRQRIPISIRGEGPLFPMEFVGRESENDTVWQVFFDLSNGLDAPASSSMRVFVSGDTSFASALKSLPSTNENKLATGILIHAIFDEILRQVLFDDGTISEITMANSKFLSLPDDHWVKSPSSIGYLINSWTMRLCNGRSLSAVVDEYRRDPSDLIKEIRSQFLGRWI